MKYRLNHGKISSTMELLGWACFFPLLPAIIFLAWNGMNTEIIIVSVIMMVIYLVSLAQNIEKKGGTGGY